MFHLVTPQRAIVPLRVVGEKTIFFNSCDVSKSYSLSDLNMVTTLLLMFLQLAVVLTGITGDALINVGDKVEFDIVEVDKVEFNFVTLVFPCNTLWQYSDGNYPNGGVECMVHV